MPRPKTNRRIFVRIQLNEYTFAEIAAWAAKSGIRDKSCVLYRAAANGGPGEVIPNTKGLAKYLQFCHDYYKIAEPRRLQEQAEAMRILQEAQKHAKEVGAQLK